MALSKSIARQLTRLEEKIQAEQSKETLHEQYERRRQEASRRHWERYYHCINQVLSVMDEEFYALALAELEAAPGENIIEASQCHETGGEGLLPPLASGVCRLARTLMYQEGLSFPVPCALPAPMCRFLQEHGEDIFRKTEYVSVGTSGRIVAAPKYTCLAGGLLCEKCYFPTPYKQGVISKWNLQAMLDGPETPDLPFKACPACGGGFFWLG